MDKIYPEDKCHGKNCKVYFLNYKGVIKECQNCGATFCEDCFTKMQSDNNGKCTECDNE